MNLKAWPLSALHSASKQWKQWSSAAADILTRECTRMKSCLVLRKLEISSLSPGSLQLPLWHFSPSPPESLYFALLHADKKCKSGHFLFLKMSLIQIIIQHLLKKRRPVSLHKSVRCHGNRFLLLLKVPTWFWIRCDVEQIRLRETSCFVFAHYFERFSVKNISSDHKSAKTLSTSSAQSYNTVNYLLYNAVK